MKVLKPGHQYEVNNSKGEPFGVMPFIDKTDSENHVEGTTTEEVLDVLIDRINTLNNRFPCKENGICLNHLQEARKILDARTADRKRRGVEGKHVA